MQIEPYLWPLFAVEWIFVRSNRYKIKLTSFLIIAPQSIPIGPVMFYIHICQLALVSAVIIRSTLMCFICSLDESRSNEPLWNALLGQACPQGMPLVSQGVKSTVPVGFTPALTSKVRKRNLGQYSDLVSASFPFSFARPWNTGDMFSARAMIKTRLIRAMIVHFFGIMWFPHCILVPWIKGYLFV